jgi:CHAT domain-containing protein
MIASVVAFWPLHAVAATPAPQLSAAWSLYYDGKSVAARRGLEDFLTGPEGQDPDKRRSALSTLLQICVHSLSDDCLVRYAPEYAEVLGKVSAATDVQRLDMARDAGYYLYAAQLARGPPDAVAAILKPGNWTHEHPYDVELYLRRQLLAADIALRLDQPLAASRSIDKVLSLAAAVNTPRDASVTLAWALSDAMETLLVLGDAERAYGLFRATGAAIGQALPPRSVDAALFSLRAGLVLEAVGRDADAQRLLDAAVASLDRIELDADVRRRLLGLALEAKAASCALQLELDCARAALARHPAADLYAEPGRVPASPGEVRYLAIRAMSAAFGQTPDPVAAEALKAPLAFRSEGGERDALQVYRAVGAALALPPGVARQARLQDAGRRIRDLARHLPEAPFGAWYRSSSLDQGLLRLALTQAEALPGQDGADVAFTLLQLASRRGRSFDADALTVLGQAHDALQRRSVHQALRLRVRRDAAERERLRTVAEAMLTGPQTGARPQLDFAVRMQFRAYAQRISAASAGLAKAGISTSGTNSVTLKQLQAVLAPDEAALMVAPGVGGLVYMCVRHDAAFRRVAPVDLGPAFTIDARLVQAALTAGNAPSDTLDAQFPVAAAVRLYDRLIRPFEPCLKPGDQILWLPALADTGLPLAALLERAPPRLGTGYDLSQAAWLARSHAVAYAGSASVIVAARTGPRPPAAAFDFLGVGDPEFSGVTAAGEDRTTILMRGVRGGATLAGLPPLPETQDELERSARGFKSATLLVENAATEGGFRRQLGGYRYLSFATHGLLRDDLQGLAEPALALTPVSGQDPLDDGLLTAPEIADLNLSARFVALSACNTANFDLSQMAQDLPALASAFAVAGVPAALGTLWPVESQTGKQVVAATFEGLRAGLGPAQALAQAQRAFLGAPPSRAYLHPRFWAPFVILGDGGLAPAADPGALNLRSVETLGDGSDEVLRIQRAPGAVLTRSSAARNGKERAPGVTASASTGHGPQWRQVSGTASAEAFLAALGARVIVGGKIAAGPSPPSKASMRPPAPRSAPGAATGWPSRWPRWPAARPWTTGARRSRW